jgi:D-alanyl-lipoteichoic acid acyltransferase DltB (MBOAT superfamily)
MKVRNTFIIFIVSGFWHGANWTFIVWGALNALYFLPLLLTKRNRQNMEVVASHSYFPSIKEIGEMTLTFGLTVFAWIFFRADNIGHALEYIKNIFTSSLFSKPEILPLMVSFLVILFVCLEWVGRREEYAIEKMGFKWVKPVRWSFYLFIALLIFLFDGNDQVFIYFQF